MEIEPRRTRTLSMRMPRLTQPHVPPPREMSLFHEGHCGCERCRFEQRVVLTCLWVAAVSLGFIFALMRMWR